MTSFVLHIPESEVQKLAEQLEPTAPKMEAVGFFCRQQVADRFASQGASGGQPWPEKAVKRWGADDGRSILTGRSASLAESFQSYGVDGEAVVFSDRPYSRVHQLGTVGKGGVLQDIKPKKAKALFIPITDRAASSERYEGAQATFFRQNYNGGTSGSPLRVATRGPKLKPGSVLFRPLVKGRIKNGKLQKWDERRGEYVDGTPDFIFMKKVSIAPRPMLPDSPVEQRAQDEFTAEVLANGQ